MMKLNLGLLVGVVSGMLLLKLMAPLVGQMLVMCLPYKATEELKMKMEGQTYKATEEEGNK